MAEQLARVSDAFQERYTIERELGRGGWSMDLGAEGASGPSASRSLPLDETVGRAVERETIPPGAG